MKRTGWPFLVDDSQIILSAGGIVSRTLEKSPLQIVLVHRTRHNDWSLPKGRLEPGEVIADAALREVREETACECEIEKALPTVRYMDRNGKPKEVRFWRMKLIVARPFVPNGEIDDVRWLTLEESDTVLTYKTDRLLLKYTFA